MRATLVLYRGRFCCSVSHSGKSDVLGKKLKVCNSVRKKSQYETLTSAVFHHTVEFHSVLFFFSLVSSKQQLLHVTSSLQEAQVVFCMCANFGSPVLELQFLHLNLCIAISHFSMAIYVLISRSEGP